MLYIDPIYIERVQFYENDKSDIGSDKYSIELSHKYLLRIYFYLYYSRFQE